MSSDVAISARNLSKEFRLGRSGRTQSLAKIIGGRVRHPIRGPGREREWFHALDDITFDVAAGEAIGVIGNNGAGKSTLLKILSQIMQPTSGYVDLVGKVGSLLEVGTGFHPELTGIENVYLNGTILGMSKKVIDGKLEQIIDFAEVHQFLETPVKRYSSGMRVRLAFAVAAYLEPEILIIDEVLSVGDYRFQAKCLDRMRVLAADEGRTVVYVSHNLVTVENLCARTMVLVDGRISFDGPTPDAVAQYVNSAIQVAGGASTGTFDLAAADRSAGSYPMQLLQRLVLRPDGGSPSSAVAMRQRLQLDVEVAGLDQVPHPNVHLGIATASGQTVFRLSSRMVPLESAHDRCTKETIVVDIPFLPLTPGDYKVELKIFDLVDGTLLDEVHEAGEFEVLPSDVFGTGYRFDAPRDGLVMVPFEWEIRPATAVPVADSP